MSQKKISVITVCLNSEKTIERTIKSVINQSIFNDIEFIIYDGDSSDQTKKIIKKYLPYISKFIIKNDKCVTDAFNNSFQFASSEIVGFLNSDDFYYDKFCVEEIIRAFKSKKIDAVYGDMKYINYHGNYIRHWKSKDYYEGAFLDGWSVPFPTFYFKKNLINYYGGFNKKFKFCDDYEFIYRLVYKKRIKIIRINKILINFNSLGRSSKFFSRIISIFDIYNLLNEDNKINFFIFLYRRYKLKIKEFI